MKDLPIGKKFNMHTRYAKQLKFRDNKVIKVFSELAVSIVKNLRIKPSYDVRRV